MQILVSGGMVLANNLQFNNYSHTKKKALGFPYC